MGTFTKKNTILFYRDFRGYTGGHQKVADYFRHVLLHQHMTAEIYFSDESVLDQNNPWFDDIDTSLVCREYNPRTYGVVFLAGMDWSKYLEAINGVNRPIINLIQHVRHGVEGQDVYKFLTQRAIRICVSKEVENSILSTGKVNGPVFSIPNGHHIDRHPDEKLFDVYILANKNPRFGLALQSILEGKGLSTKLTQYQENRSVIWDCMSRSRITIALPNKTEGFYLPALEAMKLSDRAIVPDCVGNRSFCVHHKNCLMPDYNLDSIVSETMAAINSLKSGLYNTCRNWRWKKVVRKTLMMHSLESERHAFHQIINNLDQIW